MATPIWFDYDVYMNNKLAHMKLTDPAYTKAQLESAFNSAGFVGADGAYAHYDQYGDAELVSPSAFLDVAEYYAAKLLQLQAKEPAANWTPEKLLKAFKDAGLTAGEHYALYGAAEGVNPGNDFDNAQYMADKLAQLKTTDPAGEWTAEKLQKVFTDLGYTPLSHYLAHGKGEGITPKPVADPVDPIRPSDPGKTYTLTGENDTFIGTVHNDVVNGSLDNLAGATLLDTSKADWDVINLTTTDAVSVPTSASVNGFEILNVNWQGFGDASIDAEGFKGIKEINASSSKVGFLGNLEVTNAGSATVKAGEGMKGHLQVSEVDGGTVVTGKATKATVTLDDVVNATGTVKVDSTLSEVAVNGSAAATQSATVFFAADGTLNTDETIETLTVNASGGKTITVDQSAQAVANVINTAGSGDMVLKMAGADFGASVDTVNKGNTGSLTVDIATVGATIDATKINADTIRLSAAGNSIVTAKSGQNFEVTADMTTGGFTITGNSNSSLGVSYSASQATQTTFTGVKTASITADAEALTFASLISAGNTIALLGESDVTITSLTTKVLNAAAMVGDLTVTNTATSTDMTISGATGDNTVTFNPTAVKATFIGQDGADTVNFGVLNLAAKATAVTGGGNDVVSADASALTIAAGVLNIETGAGDDTVELDSKDATTGKIVLQFGEGNDTLKLDNALLNADFTEAALTITGLENILVGTNGATFLASQLSGQALNIKSAAGAGTEILNLEGTAAKDTIDLSGFNVAGGRGSAAVVSVAGLAEDDTILLGTGAFNVVLDTRTDGGIDSVTGFNTGDVFTFAAVSGISKITAVNFDAEANIDAALAKITSTELTKGAAVTFSYKGATYVVIDDDTTAGYQAGEDAVVKLVGVTVDQAVAFGTGAFADIPTP